MTGKSDNRRLKQSDFSQLQEKSLVGQNDYGTGSAFTILVGQTHPVSL